MHPFLAALACLTLAPALGGLALRARPSPERQRWLTFAGAALGEAPLPRLPLGITDDRLFGGLDLGATVRHGKPMLQRGLLADVHERALLLPMAERQPERVIAALNSCLDQGRLTLAREGLSDTLPARFVLVAVDEGEAGEGPPASLLDRLAFAFYEPALFEAPPALPLEEGAWPEAALFWSLLEPDAVLGADAVAALRAPRAAALARLSAQEPLPEAVVRALGAAAEALAVASPRALAQACLTLRCLCAWTERPLSDPDVLAAAASLVLAPRARRLPTPAEASPEPQPDRSPSPAEAEDRQGEDASEEGEDLGGLSMTTDVLLEAIATSVPEAWLAAASAAARAPTASAGRVGARTLRTLRGRPRGVRPGALRPGDRLNVPATLRAAAPFARLRPPPKAGLRFSLTADDFRIQRYEARAATTTLFVVDASGSAALQRLGEAKGAVEAMLADSYARRDEVAMLTFRRDRVELVLPPTRALVRARRALAGIPGGGGTPLALAVREAMALGQDILRRGRQPLLVFLTDGRGNITLAGEGDRRQAEQDTEQAARALGASGLATLVLDTGRRPEPRARALAEALGAAYAPLPRSGGAGIASVVRAAQGGPRST